MRAVEEVAERFAAERVGYARLAEAFATPRLLRAGWVLRLPGADGLGCFDLPKRGLRLIHSIAREDDDRVWAHLSVSRRDRVMPTWEQLRDVWRLVYPDVTAVVVIPPEVEHVNLAEVAHAWGCLTSRAVPDFTQGGGTI